MLNFIKNARIARTLLFQKIFSNNHTVISFSIFANYSYSEKNSETVRFSHIGGYAFEDNDAKTDINVKKYTFAHNSALSDDLALILEFGTRDAYTNKTVILAFELLHAFKFNIYLIKHYKIPQLLLGDFFRKT